MIQGRVLSSEPGHRPAESASSRCGPNFREPVRRQRRGRRSRQSRQAEPQSHLRVVESRGGAVAKVSIGERNETGLRFKNFRHKENAVTHQCFAKFCFPWKQGNNYIIFRFTKQFVRYTNTSSKNQQYFFQFFLFLLMRNPMPVLFVCA